jgi:hypothetical protein
MINKSRHFCEGRGLVSLYVWVKCTHKKVIGFPLRGNDDMGIYADMKIMHSNND